MSRRFRAWIVTLAVFVVTVGFCLWAFGTNQDDVDLVVGIGRIDGGVEFLAHLRRDGVVSLGAAEDQMPHAVAGFGSYRGIAHDAELTIRSAVLPRLLRGVARDDCR